MLLNRWKEDQSTLSRCCICSVHHQQSKLGGPKLCSGLPTSDVGGHEVALRRARHRWPFLHQHPRWGALPGPERGPLPSGAGPSDHKLTHEVGLERHARSLKSKCVLRDWHIFVFPAGACLHMRWACKTCPSLWLFSARWTSTSVWGRRSSWTVWLHPTQQEWSGDTAFRLVSSGFICQSRAGLTSKVFTFCCLPHHGLHLPCTSVSHPKKKKSNYINIWSATL